MKPHPKFIAWNCPYRLAVRACDPKFIATDHQFRDRLGQLGSFSVV
jgi:hypothetical protein